MTTKFLEELKKVHSSVNLDEKKFKGIKHRGNKIPYVELFDFQRPRQLPIKRIIIGFHPQQDELQTRARELVHNTDIQVNISETPLVQRAVS